MNKSLQVNQKNSMSAYEKAVMAWDFSGLNEGQRFNFLKDICKESGLSLKKRPFTYITFDGKLIPYINAGGCSQLRFQHGLSSQITFTKTNQETQIHEVGIKVIDKKGGFAEDIGAISIAGLRGKELANAYMKAVTKGLRRATLSYTGLSKFDSPTGEDSPIVESEVHGRTEEIIEKIETNQRPEFENEAPSSSMIQEAPHPYYILRTMRGAKGKPINQVPLKKLTEWLKYYDQMMSEGSALSPEVQDESIHVRDFLTSINEGKQNGN